MSYDHTRTNPLHDVDGAAAELERSADHLYGLALRITGLTDDAESAILEVFRAIPPGKISGLSRWLVLRVAHAAHERLRRRRPHVEPLVFDDVVPALDGDGQHFAPMNDWSRRIGDQTLLAAIDTLPPDPRTALVLHDVEGVAAADIADVLGVDESAAKLHIHGARLFVRKRLAEHFDVEPARTRSIH